MGLFHRVIFNEAAGLFLRAIIFFSSITTSILTPKGSEFKGYPRIRDAGNFESKLQLDEICIIVLSWNALYCIMWDNIGRF